MVSGGASKIFTAGLDLKDNFLAGLDEADVGRRGLAFRQHIIDFQDAFTAMEKCPQPVIAAVHSLCVGAGVDLITACDMRFCSADAQFCVKEVDVGLAADVGTLQRLGKVMGVCMCGASKQTSCLHA